MLSLLITVFIFCIVAMLIMVIRKAIAIKGLPHVPEKPFILDGTPHPHRIRKFIKEISKEGVHIVLLTFTKGWLLIEKEWKRMLRRYFPKMHDVLYEQPQICEKATSSFFLSTITEYKEKTKRLRERITKESAHEIREMITKPKVRKPREPKATKEVHEVVNEANDVESDDNLESKV